LLGFTSNPIDGDLLDPRGRLIALTGVVFARVGDIRDELQTSRPTDDRAKLAAC
jgi:hypothetical protein